MWIWLVVAALAAPAAKQGKFDSDKQGEIQRLSWSFVDEAGRSRKIVASFPTEQIVADNAVPRQFPKGEAASVQVRAIERYADETKGPKIKAKANSSGGVSIKVSGKNAGKMREALAGASTAAETALDKWLSKHRYTRLRGGEIVADHARLAAEYGDEVAPLAEALAIETSDEREFIRRSLRFVQAIPYESKRSGADAGYRRPLSVLARNKGDCDSKATLFLALVRSRYPNLASTVVIIPNHAFAAVALSPEPGERSFMLEGTRYVALEPVGPAAVEPGKVSGASGWHLFWGSNEKRPLPSVTTFGGASGIEP